jgi:hypothetical protein
MNTINTSLNVQIRRIESDLAELFFNPREADLRIGETLTLRERESGRAVIVQIIAFRSASYPALAREQMESLAGISLSEEEVLKLEMAIVEKGGQNGNGNGNGLRNGQHQLALANFVNGSCHKNGDNRKVGMAGLPRCESPAPTMTKYSQCRSRGTTCGWGEL